MRERRYRVASGRPFSDGTDYVATRNGQARAIAVFLDGKEIPASVTADECLRYARSGLWTEIDVPDLAARLIALQEQIREIREDCRDHDFKIEIDARMNHVEAELGDCIALARGDNQ